MIKFLLVLLLSAIGFVICYFIVATPLFLLAGLARMVREKMQGALGQIITYPIYAAIFLGFGFLMFFWGAYLAKLTVVFAEGRSLAFLYYIAGFFCCVATIGRMAAQDAREDPLAAVGTFIYIVIAVFTYGLFSIFPAMNPVEL